MTRTPDQIAQRLNQIAPGNSKAERALRDLATKLTAKDYAGLAGVDLVEAYAPEVILPHGNQWLRWTANVLELCRDVLIFVPVLYTWWQLSKALRAYDQYSGNEPFLLAWQRGFGGHAQRLSTTALVVAGVVLGIIVLTLLTSILRTWNDAIAQSRQQELAVLLAELGLALNQSQAAVAGRVSRKELAAIGTTITASSLSLQEALEKAGKDISGAVDTGPGSKLHEMFVKWTAAADELKTLGARLHGAQETAAKLSEIQNQLSGAVTRIGDQTRQLLAAIDAERQVWQADAQAHLTLATRVDDSAKQLESTLKGLGGRVDDFNEMVHRLVFLVKTLDANGRSGEPGGGLY